MYYRHHCCVPLISGPFLLVQSLSISILLLSIKFTKKNIIDPPGVLCEFTKKYIMAATPSTDIEC